MIILIGAACNWFKRVDLVTGPFMYNKAGSWVKKTTISTYFDFFLGPRLFSSIETTFFDFFCQYKFFF